MKSLNLTTLIFAVIILFSSCKKNKIANSNSANTAKEFAALFGTRVQSLKINGSTTNTFTLKEVGTKIVIPAGTLRIAGVPVTGDITINALEMLKRSAVIFSGTNTNHISGAPLASDGFIYLITEAQIKTVINSLDGY